LTSLPARIRFCRMRLRGLLLSCLLLGCGGLDATRLGRSSHASGGADGSSDSGPETSGAGGAGEVCLRGDTRTCFGPGACRGAQTCAPDRLGWTACDCGNRANTGGSSSMDAASNTGGGETGGRAATGGVSAGTGGASSGGSSSGGRLNSGGAVATGGVSATGGASGCYTSQKICGGVCVPPAPSNGCGPSGCTPCPEPAPANGVVACDDTTQTCSFVCLSGFTKSGNACVSNVGGGTGGTSDGGSCVPASCPTCGPIVGPACCVNGRCGCPILSIPGTCQ
jgi:hypothetical protein